MSLETMKSVLENTVIEDEDDAAAVLVAMHDLLRDRGNFGVSVGEFKALTSQSDTQTFKDFLYGWKDLTGSRVVQVDGGYRIEFPDPSFIGW